MIKNIQGLFLGVLQVSTDSKFISSVETIKLEYIIGKVFCTLLENVDGITLELDVGTVLGSLYGSFKGLNHGKLEGVLFKDSLESSDGKMLGSDEGIKLDLLMVQYLSLYLEKQMESYVGFILAYSQALQMYHLMVITMSSLMAYFQNTHWGLLMVNFLTLMKASNLNLLMINFLILYQ